MSLGRSALNQRPDSSRQSADDGELHDDVVGGVRAVGIAVPTGLERRTAFRVEQRR